MTSEDKCARLTARAGTAQNFHVCGLAADGSKNIAVTADIHDIDAAQALMVSPPPEIAAQIEAHGVIPPSTALHRSAVTDGHTPARTLRVVAANASHALSQASDNS